MVALVITVIILLILAAITFGTLKGDDGIIEEATDAKEETRAARIEEIVEVWKLRQEGDKYKQDKTSQTLEELLEELKSQELITTEESTAIKSTGEITIGSKKIVFKEKGITASAIANSTDKRVYYGAEVTGYSCASAGVSKWRIFYADVNNIYLIADDFISLYDMPDSEVDLHYQEPGIYRLSLEETPYHYSGSDWILGKTDGKDNSLAKDLLSNYFDYTPDNGSTYPNRVEDEYNYNMRAIAYMLDTKIWGKKYAGLKAEYAIGGPTLEMFVESYKQTHPDSSIRYTLGEKRLYV